MAERFSSFYQFTDDQTLLSAATFNAIFRDIDARLAVLEKSNNGIEAVLDQLREFGVQRINDAIEPLIAGLGDVGSDELAAAQTSLAAITQIESDIQALYNDIQVGNFGSINVTGSIQATGDIFTAGNIYTTDGGFIHSAATLTSDGNITGNNLAGTNTGNEANASGANFGVVKFEQGGANTGFTFSQDYILSLHSANNALALENQNDIAGFSQQVAALITIINEQNARITELENGAPPAPSGDSILFISAPSIVFRDELLRDALIAAGRPVTVVSETSNNLATTAASYDLVVLAGDATAYGSSHLSELRDIAVPIVVMDTAAIENLGLGDIPIYISVSGITIANAHPIVNGFSGTVNMLSNISGSQSAKWKKGAGAFDIAPDGANSLLFTYDVGANIFTGQAAAARRVCWGLVRGPLNADGETIFLQAIQWALGEI